jgi:hypothetical protein
MPQCEARRIPLGFACVLQHGTYSSHFLSVRQAPASITITLPTAAEFLERMLHHEASQPSLGLARLRPSTPHTLPFSLFSKHRLEQSANTENRFLCGPLSEFNTTKRSSYCKQELLLVLSAKENVSAAYHLDSSSAENLQLMQLHNSELTTNCACLSTEDFGCKEKPRKRSFDLPPDGIVFKFKGTGNNPPSYALFAVTAPCWTTGVSNTQSRLGIRVPQRPRPRVLFRLTVVFLGPPGIRGL